MTEEIKTLGEFMDEVVRACSPEVQVKAEFWFEQCKWVLGEVGEDDDISSERARILCEEAWGAYRFLSLSRDGVIDFADRVTSQISAEASHWSSQAPYERTCRCGHTFLKEIYHQAVVRSIEVEIDEIDGPLDVIEIMAAIGCLERVSLGYNK